VPRRIASPASRVARRVPFVYRPAIAFFRQSRARASPRRLVASSRRRLIRPASSSPRARRRRASRVLVRRASAVGARGETIHAPTVSRRSSVVVARRDVALVDASSSPRPSSIQIRRRDRRFPSSSRVRRRRARRRAVARDAPPVGVERARRERGALREHRARVRSARGDVARSS